VQAVVCDCRLVKAGAGVSESVSFPGIALYHSRFSRWLDFFPV
jgi:hypothetical protein